MDIRNIILHYLISSGKFSSTFTFLFFLLGSSSASEIFPSTLMPISLPKLCKYSSQSFYFALLIKFETRLCVKHCSTHLPFLFFFGPEDRQMALQPANEQYNCNNDKKI